VSSGQSANERLAAVLAEMPEVRLGFLYGSRARGESRSDSDFDIALLVDESTAREERGAVIRRLASRLGRAVSSTLLDLVILNDAGALFRHRVLRDGTLLYQRSPEDRVRFAIRAIQDYQDGFYRRSEFTKKRIERLKSRKTDGGSRDLLEKARRAGRLLGKAKGVR
jgi:predicted nucleotidyltransferase